MDLGLRGRRALVTGASKGIGFGVANGLAEEGCAVGLVARTAEMLDAAGAVIEQRHEVEVARYPLDLCKSAVIPDLLESFGTPDILVNNAGAIPGGDLESIDEETWRSAWDLKVFGYVNLARACYARMRERGSGVIVNVTGLAGERYDYSYIAGTAGNAGLNAFTRALGGYSLEHGVRVLAVAPGATETERLVGLLKIKARDVHGDESRWSEFLSGMPTGRAATVDEVADVVVFLASDRAAYVSGVVVNVDGGHGARGGSFTK